MDISDIHFHDTRILRVIEDTATDTLTMEVQYPTDWQQGIYELRHLVFEDAYAYTVTEGPFQGSPVILEASIVGSHLHWSRLRLDINAVDFAGARPGRLAGPCPARSSGYP